jgi:hypothetical protein
MTTKPKMPESAVAPKKMGSNTPVLTRAGDNAASSTSSKSFDPDRFQAHRMPPGFLGELLSLELPSMPKERIEETMPPTSAEELFAYVPQPATSGNKTASTSPPPRPSAPASRIAIPGALVLLLTGGLVFWLWNRETKTSLGAPTVPSQEVPTTPSERKTQLPALQPTFPIEHTSPPVAQAVSKISSKSKKNVSGVISKVPNDPKKSATLPPPESPKSRAHFDDPE